MTRTGIILALAPLLAAGAMTLPNCFSPKISEGVICGEGESCPPGMQCDPLDGRCRFELLGQGEDLRMFPVAVPFGPVVVGNTSSPSIFSVANTGLVPSNPLEVRLSESDHFEITDNDCEGATLQPDASCSFTGFFKPTAAGELTNAVTVNDGDNAAASTITGTGLAPGDLRIQPTNFDFLNRQAASADAPETVSFTVQNTGSSDTGALTVSVPAPSFIITSNACDRILKPGENCVVQVGFDPKEAGYTAASITVSASPGGATSSSFNGTGVATLTVEHSGSSGGYVSSEPEGISCEPLCAEEFGESPVILTANPGFVGDIAFVGWTGAAGCNTSPTCEVQMTSSKVDVMAHWACVPGNSWPKCNSDGDSVDCSDNGESIQDCDELGCNSESRRCNLCEPNKTTCSNGTEVTCSSEGTPSSIACVSGFCVGNSCGDIAIMDAGIGDGMVVPP